MHRFYPLIFAAITSLIISGIVLLLLRYLHPEWWKRKAVRYPVLLLALGGLVSLIIWAAGIYNKLEFVAYAGAVLASAIFMIQLSLIVSLPLSGFVHIAVKISAYFEYRKRKTKSVPRIERRIFLKKAAAAFPAVALSSQIAGIAGSYSKIAVPVIKLTIPNLPESLEGFKIAHLSDSHIGNYTTLYDLEKTVEEIKSHAPDLALVTGDISDDLSILSDANRIISQIEPPLGVYASVGNHEYYRGISRVKAIFEKSPYPMLIDESAVVKKGSTAIFIGGADDPVSLRKVSTDFLRDTVRKTMESAPSDSFKILMSHRPRGLDYAAAMDVDLVLAGHTHGGQLGFFGQSAFEAVWPELYIWGIYRKKNTTLYTSSGVGHWMPFRLGCPAEAPILVLEKDKAATEQS